jgi:hypothetical protein
VDRYPLPFPIHTRACMCVLALLIYYAGSCYTLLPYLTLPYSTALSLETWTVAVFVFCRLLGEECGRRYRQADIDRTGDSISISGTAAGAGSALGGLEGSGYPRLGFCLCLFVCLWGCRGVVGTALQVNNTGKYTGIHACLPAFLVPLFSLISLVSIIYLHLAGSV